MRKKTKKLQHFHRPESPHILYGTCQHMQRVADKLTCHPDGQGAGTKVSAFGASLLPLLPDSQARGLHRLWESGISGDFPGDSQWDHPELWTIQNNCKPKPVTRKNLNRKKKVITPQFRKGEGGREGKTEEQHPELRGIEIQL